ncbi:MAG: hypothetical protein ACFFDH_04120 [Promethearchaeota archaeon]
MYDLHFKEKTIKIFKNIKEAMKGLFNTLDYHMSHMYAQIK